MKRALFLVALLALILGGASLLYVKIFGSADLNLAIRFDAGSGITFDAAFAGKPGHKDAAASNEDAGPNALSTAELLDLRGQVRRRMANGRWESLAKNAVLGLDDRRHAILREKLILDEEKK